MTLNKQLISRALGAGSLRGIPFPTDQPELFPVRAAFEFPGITGTADAWGKVNGLNGKNYIVKAEQLGLQHVRASELFCAGLAGAIGLQCPPFDIIQMTAGELFFGSEEIVGVADRTETTRILTSMTDGEEVRAPGLAMLLSSVFAFDMFIHNVDRHDQNFLSVVFHGTRQFFLIDHARSMFSFWPLQDFPPPGCGTRVTAGRVRMRHGFDPEAACAMVDRIGTVAPSVISGLLRRMPSGWLSAGLSQEIETWWGASAFEARLQRLRKGLEDESLL